MSLSANEVVDYLQNHPEFLLNHPSVFSMLDLPDPHSGKTVSLHERQMQVLRERYKHLELKLAEMSRLAAENQAIVQKLQSWHRDLLRQKDLSQLPHVVIQGLGSLFSVPTVHLGLWKSLNVTVDAGFVSSASESDQQQVSAIDPLYCGPSTGVDLHPWLGASHNVKSLAFIPLRVGLAPEPFGVLILGSPDAGRYTLDMGRDFLLTIQESASAALSRLLA